MENFFNILLNRINNGIISLKKEKQGIQIFNINDKAKEIFNINQINDKTFFNSTLFKKINTNDKIKIEEIIKNIFNNKNNDIIENISININLDSSIISAKLKIYSISINPKNEFIIIEITEQKNIMIEPDKNSDIIDCISDISKSLIETVDYEKELEIVIGKIGISSGSDSVFIFKKEFNNNDVIVNLIKYWIRDNVTIQKNNELLHNLYLSKGPFNSWYKKLLQKQHISGNIEDFSEHEKVILEEQNLKSILVIPIFLKNEFWGYIEFNNVVLYKTWHESEISLLSIVANIIGTAIQKKEISLEIENYRYHLEELVQERTKDIFEINKQLKDEIIQRKKYEEKIRDNEERYKNLIDNISIGIAIVQDDKILFVNPSLCEITKRKEKELLNHNLSELINNTDLIINDKPLNDNNLTTRQVILKLKYEEIYLESTPIEIKYNNKKSIMYLIHDITNRKRNEQKIEETLVKLQKSNDELSEFVFIASHDLQEPLRKIQSFSSRVLKIYFDLIDTKGKDYLVRMNNAASRMQTLINHLLILSRVTTKGKNFEMLNLDNILNNIILEIKNDIDDNINISFNKESLPSVIADSIQIKQLFQHILNNAIKFRKPETNSIINITNGKKSKNNIQIIIEDNGIGFEQKYSEKIFGVFQRLHPRSKYDGTGIGLAICRKIVDRHNGNIKAYGFPGKGTKIIIELPKKQ